MGNPNPHNKWEPGKGPKKTLWKPGEYGGYSQWLKNLTPEQYAEHLRERAHKRTIKAEMQKAQATMAEAWVEALDRAAASVLQKAINTGDPQALQVVWDRYVGKPATEVEMSVENRQDNFQDIMTRVKQIAQQGDNNGDIKE